MMTLWASQSQAEILYDGETATYSTGQAWDKNGSTIMPSKAAPYSSPKHIRAKIVVKNWWGSVAYMPKNFQPIDISSQRSFSVYLKAAKPANIILQLFDANKQTSAKYQVPVETTYSQYIIPLKAFSGVDLAKITAIVFAASQKAPISHTIDIDNIEALGAAVPEPSPTPSPAGTAMKTNGRFLYDACGQKMVLRGVNQMTCWTDWVGTPRDGMPMFAEIAKTGANVVRMSWIRDAGAGVPPISIAQLDAAITNVVANKMVPMPELHDYTCGWSAANITNVISFWTQPEMIALIKKHQKYLLLNFANEMSAPSTAEYVKEYSRALVALRAAGIHVPIVFDASGCGQDENSILAGGPLLIEADPDHNVVMSLHIYWMDQNAARIAKVMADATAKNIPLIIGEFASVSVDCTTPILYKEIIKQAQINEVGYLSWSWDNQNACAAHSMTKDSNQSFSTLWGWALELAVTDPGSIKNTSVKSNCF
jgi:mannan endo-1,4-beta-mannosidase